MDSVTSAVMVLLFCSPDLMLCREPAAKPAVFSTVSQCEQVLGDQLSKVPQRQRAVGRCQAIIEASDAARWGISPNGELFYASAADITKVAPVSAGLAKASKRQSEPATVRVTRGNGSGEMTTSSYTVSRTGSN